MRLLLNFRVILALLILFLYFGAPYLPAIGRWLGGRVRKARDWEPPAEEAMGQIAESNNSEYLESGLAEAAARVERIAAKIGAASGSSEKVRVQVINRNVFNACVLPGGEVCVFRGLIETMPGDDELAAVLAHEVAHLRAGHVAQQMARQWWLRLISLPAMVLGGWGGAIARGVVTVVGPLALMKYSRENEREADRLSVEYLRAAGYDPEAAVRMLERVGEEEKAQRAGMADWMVSHPPAAERIAVVRAAIAG